MNSPNRHVAGEYFFKQRSPLLLEFCGIVEFDMIVDIVVDIIVVKLLELVITVEVDVVDVAVVVDVIDIVVVVLFDMINYSIMKKKKKVLIEHSMHDSAIEKKHSVKFT